MNIPTSQIMVVALDTPEGVGRPIFVLATYPGGVAELVVYPIDPASPSDYAVVPVEGPADVLQKVAGLRRIGQRYPTEYVTLNITDGNTTLVA
jgi:hypothetical protein